MTNKERYREKSEIHRRNEYFMTFFLLSLDFLKKKKIHEDVNLTTICS